MRAHKSRSKSCAQRETRLASLEKKFWYLFTQTLGQFLNRKWKGLKIFLVKSLQNYEVKIFYFEINTERVQDLLFCSVRTELKKSFFSSLAKSKTKEIFYFYKKKSTWIFPSFASKKTLISQLSSDVWICGKKHRISFIGGSSFSSSGSSHTHIKSYPCMF